MPLKHHLACEIRKTVLKHNSKQRYATFLKTTSQISSKVTAQNVSFHCTNWLLNYTFCVQLHVRITPASAATQAAIDFMRTESRADDDVQKTDPTFNNLNSLRQLVQHSMISCPHQYRHSNQYRQAFTLT